jgi:hypothetical protein
MELRAELPDELAGWVHDAARRFNVEPSVIIHRALEHYLRHMAQVRDASRAQSGHRRVAIHARDGGPSQKGEYCPFPECPYENGCPGEICAL